jgi:hypothetical protein
MITTLAASCAGHSRSSIALHHIAPKPDVREEVVGANGERMYKDSRVALDDSGLKQYRVAPERSR